MDPGIRQNWAGLAAVLVVGGDDQGDERMEKGNLVCMDTNGGGSSSGAKALVL